MTARRERNNLLVPGLGSASNTLRPPNSRSRPSSRNHLYSLSGGSSSSLLPAQSERDGSSGAPQGSADPSHLEAPYLTTAETHLGRVTLTAPDNMRRRREEEREKRAKAKRKKKAQATAAAAALAGGAGPSQAGPSSRPITPLAGPPTADAAGSSSRRGTESRNPRTAQPARPTSAMESRERRRAASRSNSVGSTQSASAAVGRGEDAGANSALPAEGTAQAPASDPAAQTLAEAALAAEIASISSAHQASLRRHNIYASLSEIAPGLSEDETDPDDLPPPFPEGATRPRSPPQPPGEPEGPGGTWTEAQMRQQEEAERWRVPDSPPPAFRSDDEGEAVRSTPARTAEARPSDEGTTATTATVEEPSSSESEGESAEIAADRRAWEDDLAAGLSLEERIARERERREARERMSIGLAVLQARARRGLVDEVEGGEEDEADGEAEDEGGEGATDLAEGNEGDTSATATTPPVSPPATRESLPAEVSSESAAVASAPPPASSPIAHGGPVSLSATSRAPTRTSAAPPSPQRSPGTSPAPAPEASPPQQPARSPRPASTATTGGPSAPSTAPSQSQRPTAPPGAAPRKVQVSTHRRTVSDGRTTAASNAQQASRLVDQIHHRPKPTQVRARPASESHSRFRDDATAAAERRRKIWAGMTSGQLSVPVATPFLPQSSTGQANPVATAVFRAPAPEPRAESPPSTPSEPSDAESSSSELEWQKEAAAFEALRRTAERRPVVETDSESEEDVAVPGRFAGRRSSLDIGQVQAPVPRAPPPLVLGRSRGGGAAYSSSSESSDEDDGRLYSSSEDERDKEARAQELQAPQPVSFAELRARSRRIAIDSGTEPATSPEPDSRHGHSGSSWHSHRSAGLTRSDSTTSSHSSQAPFVADDGQDATIAEQVAARFGAPLPPKQADKGKAPVRPHDWLLSPSTSIVSRQEAVAAPAPPSERAGSFVADLSSSDEGESSEDDEANKTLRQPPLPSNGRALPAVPSRPAVQNRLKGLFDAPLAPTSPESAASAAAARASVDHLFSTPLLEPSSRPRSGLSRRSSGRSGDGSVTDEDATRALRPMQPPIEDRRPPPQSQTIVNMSEDDARDSALRDIAALRARTPGRQDGLTALERLLLGGGNRGHDSTASARPLPEPPMLNPQRASLTRSGAIVQRYPPPRSSAEAYSRPSARPASFVNPRSVNAPRPLGRLPTITDATRHFPRAREPASAAETPTTPQNESLMASIPDSEHQGLQRPLEPMLMRAEAQPSGRPMPALPPRPVGGVSAMISRFEAASGADPARSHRMSMPVQPPQNGAQPTWGYEVRQHLPSAQTALERPRQEVLARRPPPPPPVAATGTSSQRPSLLEPEPPLRAALTPSPRTQAMQALTSGATIEHRTPSSPFLPPPSNAQFGVSLAAGGAARAARDRGAPTGADRPDRSISPMGLGLALDRNGAASPVHPQQIRGQAPIGREAPSPVPVLAPRTARPLPTPPHIPSSPTQRRAPPSPPAPRPASRPEAAMASSRRPDSSQAAPSPSSRPARTDSPPRQASADDSDAAQVDESPQPAPRGSNPGGDGAAQPAPTQASASSGLARRQPSLGITDLDLLASRLEAEGAHYDEITALAEFLGPAKDTRATAEEMAALPVGRVEVDSRRVTKDGKVKTRLSVVGVRVDRCAICLLQFKAGQMACLFPCMHVFHEACATRLLRETRNCPSCRRSIAAEQ